MKKLILILALSLSYFAKVNGQKSDNGFIRAEFTPIRQNISLMNDDNSEIKAISCFYTNELLILDGNKVVERRINDDPFKEDKFEESSGFIYFETYIYYITESNNQKYFRVFIRATTQKAFWQLSNDYFGVSTSSNAIYNDKYLEPGLNVHHMTYDFKVRHSFYNKKPSVYSNYGIVTKFDVTYHRICTLFKVEQVYSFSANNDFNILSCYMHDDRIFPTNVSIGIGPLSFEIPNGTVIPYTSKPVFVDYEEVS